LRAFVARLEKEARERTPTRAMRGRRSGTVATLSRPGIRAQLLSEAKKK
jgi:hypothetical protein